jgi:hypothetical protein
MSARDVIGEIRGGQSEGVGVDSLQGVSNLSERSILPVTPTPDCTKAKLQTDCVRTKSLQSARLYPHRAGNPDS